MGLRVLELYSGIGGMHFALERLGQPYEVIEAIEINSNVLATYKFNFPATKASNRNILSLSAQEINRLNIDTILLSPPCQPFCRSGLQGDTSDTRTNSLTHLLTILPDVNFEFILLENVKGFETSEAHEQLLQCLNKCGFEWQEFLISPNGIGIPNSRLRYYLIGKRNGISWCFERSKDILETIPGSEKEAPYSTVLDTESTIWGNRRKMWNPEDTNPCRIVGDIMERTEEKNSKYSLPQLEKYVQAIDIVNLNSTNTCCFTRSYGTYFKGTGSILEYEDHENPNQEGFKKLRFFSPREVARLMCFPETFKFPPGMTLKQQYKGLGNSINVFVVAILLSLLIQR